MNDKIHTVYTVQRIGNYHVVAISEAIYQNLRLKDDTLKLIVSQNKILLEGSRFRNHPSSPTSGKEVDADVL